jgi:hypothetical protein
MWTHVAGCIRWYNFDEKFGPAETLRRSRIPEGSEGPLDFLVCEDGIGWAVSIFGDLRHYNDQKAVIKWFTRICKKGCVRQATLTIDTEGTDSVNLTLFGDRMICTVLK